MTTVIQTQEKAIEFTPFGAADKIKLTVNIVKNIVAVPTKSGKTCTDRDAMKFIMLCQAQRLNPFAGDAFLIGYDSQQTGPTFSLITAHQAFLKRAETCQDFEGMESGIILQEDNGEIKEREGDFHLSDEKVVGGWARVHRKGRKPTYRRIRLERFNNGFAQWKVDPAGMIVKCAESDALRSTFPTLLGGLYSEGEIIDISTDRIAAELPTERMAQLAPAHDSGASAEPTPAANRPTASDTGKTPQQELEALVTEAGFTFEQLQAWGDDTRNITDPTSLSGFDEIKAEEAKRLLRAKVGLLKGLEAVKGAGQ